MQEALFVAPKIFNAVKLRYLSVTFKQPLEPYKTPGFRGAIATLMKKYDRFHNHINDEQSTKQGYYYRYPLIQYKNNGTCPIILFLGEAVDDAYHLFAHLENELQIYKESYPLEIGDLRTDQLNIQIWEHDFHYNIFNWMAFNYENYRRFQALESIVEQIQFLENIMVGHILAFATGVGWQANQEINVQITNLPQEKFISFKNMKMQTFSLSFKSNVYLPELISLGRSISRGLGVVRHLKTKKK